MKIHSTNYELMDELLKQARQESPLLNSQEVEDVIRNGRTRTVTAPKGLSRFIGMRTLMVATGVLIVSLLAYTTIKSNKKDIASSAPVENSSKNVSANAGMPAASPQLIAEANDNKAATDDKVNKPNAAIVAANENKKSIAKPASKPESDLSANISSVKISESFNMVSKKGNTNSAASENKESNKEVAISFDYNAEKVRMNFSGNDLKELAIDNKTVAPEKFEEYNSLISEARKLVRHKGDTSKSQSGKQSGDDETSNLNLVQLFNTQLHSDHIVGDGMAYSFQLTSSQLLINNAAQGDDQFQKYKKLYQTKTGKMLKAGSEYSFEKGGKKN